MRPQFAWAWHPSGVSNRHIANSEPIGHPLRHSKLDDRNV